MNPLLLPPRLVLRALEDLHAVAAAAGDLTSRLNGIEERAEHIEATMRRAVDVAIAIEHRAGQVLTVAERSVEQFEALLRMADRIEERATAVIAVGERLEQQAEGILTLGGTVEGRAREVVGAAVAIEQRAVDVLDLGRRVDERGAEIAEEGRLLRETAAEVARRGAEVAEALPLLERAIAVAEPLEGAVERFARIVDRLPRPPAPRRARSTTPPPD